MMISDTPLLRLPRYAQVCACLAAQGFPLCVSLVPPGYFDTECASVMSTEFFDSRIAHIIQSYPQV